MSAGCQGAALRPRVAQRDTWWGVLTTVSGVVAALQARRRMHMGPCRLHRLREGRTT